MFVVASISFVLMWMFIFAGQYVFAFVCLLIMVWAAE